MKSSDEYYEKLNDAIIMIVDDEPINIEVVQIFLEELGYKNFVTVDDSTQAMKTLEENGPDLLLLDLTMPEVSGFDILSEVRAHPKYKYLPVIILTAATDTKSKLKALGLGATDFLSKPLDSSELGLRVRNTLAAKAYQDQLAFYDSKTKLPNRHLFMENLSRALKSAKRFNDQLALLCIEINNFDQIKDTLGINAGDEVLRIVASRIQDTIRAVDVLSHPDATTDRDMSLFHLERSDFLLILERIQGVGSPAIVAQRIIQEILAPMPVMGKDIYAEASIGIATYPSESGEPSELLRLASSAKDYVKKQEENSFQFSSIAINKMYERRRKLESKLRKALDNDELILYYQPKVNVKSGGVVGVEALLRWKSDEGFVSPDQFIPLAEETGLIVSIGEWVLKEGCRQLNEWHMSGYKFMTMAVNLSARQFADDDFIPTVNQIIRDSGIDTAFLTMEITESLLLDNIEDKIKLMQKLKEMGMKLSIDDFGTGYSSLSYLRKLPVDELKIDKSFINEVSESADSRAIVSTIAFLAKNLNLSTVSEGIEKKAQLDFLQTIDCDTYQGFLFSGPVPGDKLIALLHPTS
jgi:diguanylate cyclase